MEQREIEFFIEAALLAAGRPLNLDQMQALFDGRSTPDKALLRTAIKALNDEYEDRGIVIAEVASGFRMQVRSSMADRLQKLWEERPPRYSRALFETLALIAYRQPITRGEIEEVRGVSVSSNIMRSLAEREWIRVVGHRDVPGRPAMFGTTKTFLDYFSLKRLEDLPELADLSDWESLRVQLDLPDVEDTTEDIIEDTNEESATAMDGDAPSNVSELPMLAREGDEESEPGDLAENKLPELTDLVADDGDEKADTLIAIDDDDSDAAAAPEEVALDAEASVTADDSESSVQAGTAEAGTDVPTLTSDSDEDEEELVVSEWPDPVEAGGVATVESGGPKKDASANNG